MLMDDLDNRSASSVGYAERAPVPTTDVSSHRARPRHRRSPRLRPDAPRPRREAPASLVGADASSEEVRHCVRLAQDGDTEAFGRLYERFQPEIVRYLTHRTGNPDLADDLAQQVFLKAWRAIPRYRDRGYPFRSWLYRIAHNQMVDHYRTERYTSDLEGVDPSEQSQAEERVLQRELHERLRFALDRLSEDHRQVLVMRFLMEKSAREIGEVMGRKEVTVRGLQLRALRALRREITAMGGLP